MQTTVQTSKKKKEEKRCYDCGTTNTPLWRLGPAGPKTMCNACGIKWKRRNSSSGRKTVKVHPTYKHSDERPSKKVHVSSDDSADNYISDSDHASLASSAVEETESSKPSRRTRTRAAPVYPTKMAHSFPRLPHPPIARVCASINQDDDIFLGDGHSFNIKSTEYKSIMSQARRKSKPLSPPKTKLYTKGIDDFLFLAAQELLDVRAEISQDVKFSQLNSQMCVLEDKLNEKSATIVSLEKALSAKERENQKLKYRLTGNEEPPRKKVAVSPNDSDIDMSTNTSTSTISQTVSKLLQAAAANNAPMQGRCVPQHQSAFMPSALSATASKIPIV